MRGGNDHSGQFTFIYLIILSIKFYIVFIYLFLRLRAFRMYLNDLDLD